GRRGEGFNEIRSRARESEVEVRGRPVGTARVGWAASPRADRGNATMGRRRARGPEVWRRRRLRPLPTDFGEGGRQRRRHLSGTGRPQLLFGPCERPREQLSALYDRERQAQHDRVLTS